MDVIFTNVLIVIPSSVKKIGYTAFKECKSLIKIGIIQNLEIITKLPEEIRISIIGDNYIERTCFASSTIRGMLYEEIAYDDV